jgi:hypothetical protein
MDLAHGDAIGDHGLAALGVGQNVGGVEEPGMTEPADRAVVLVGEKDPLANRSYTDLRETSATLRVSSTGLGEADFRKPLPAVRSARRAGLSTRKAIARSINHFVRVGLGPHQR